MAFQLALHIFGEIAVFRRQMHGDLPVDGRVEGQRQQARRSRRRLSFCGGRQAYPGRIGRAETSPGILSDLMFFGLITASWR
jgi:hypothetical protein